MRVKNISGSSRQFSFGDSGAYGDKPESVFLANNQEGNVSDRASTVASAARLQRQGVLEIITPPDDFLINEAVPKLVSVTMTNASDAETVTVAGVAFTTLPLSSTALEAATDLAAAINANTTLRAQGVFARDAYVSGANAVVLIELPAALAVGVVTSGDGTNAAVATVQATALAAETLKSCVRSVVAAGTGLVIATGLRDVRFVQLTVLRAGVLTYITSTVTLSGGLVILAANGATNLASGDVVHCLAMGTVAL
jgi:hypothetical protein